MSEKLKFYIHKDPKTTLVFHRGHDVYNVFINKKIAHSEHQKCLNEKNPDTIEIDIIRKNNKGEKPEKIKIKGYEIKNIEYDPNKIYTNFIYDILLEDYQKILNKIELAEKEKIEKKEGKEEKMSSISNLLNKFYDLNLDKEKTDITNHMKKIQEDIDVIIDKVEGNAKEKFKKSKQAIKNINIFNTKSIVDDFSKIFSEIKFEMGKYTEEEKNSFLKRLNYYEQKIKNIDFYYKSVVEETETMEEIPKNIDISDFHVFFEKTIGMRILGKTSDFKKHESKHKNKKELRLDAYIERKYTESNLHLYYLVDFKFRTEIDNADLYKSIVYSLFFESQANSKEKTIEAENILGLMISPTHNTSAEIKRVYQLGKFYFFDIGYPIDNILEMKYNEFSKIEKNIKNYLINKKNKIETIETIVFGFGEIQFNELEI